MNLLEINEMDNLKQIILEDDYYSSLLYYVSFYDCINSDKRGLTVHKKIRFGNETGDMMQRVDINIYKDKVTLHCSSEGALYHERELDIDKQHSVESCIIQALDEWRCYYNN